MTWIPAESAGRAGLVSGVSAPVTPTPVPKQAFTVGSGGGQRVKPGLGLPLTLGNPDFSPGSRPCPLPLLSPTSLQDRLVSQGWVDKEKFLLAWTGRPQTRGWKGLLPQLPQDLPRWAA